MFHHAPDTLPAVRSFREGHSRRFRKASPRTKPLPRFSPERTHRPSSLVPTVPVGMPFGRLRVGSTRPECRGGPSHGIPTRRTVERVDGQMPRFRFPKGSQSRPFGSPEGTILPLFPFPRTNPDQACVTLRSGIVADSTAFGYPPNEPRGQGRWAPRSFYQTKPPAILRSPGAVPRNVSHTADFGRWFMAKVSNAP